MPQLNPVSATPKEKQSNRTAFLFGSEHIQLTLKAYQGCLVCPDRHAVTVLECDMALALVENIVWYVPEDTGYFGDKDTVQRLGVLQAKDGAVIREGGKGDLLLCHLLLLLSLCHEIV